MKNLIKIRKAIIMVMFVITFGTLSSANATIIIYPDTKDVLHTHDIQNYGVDSGSQVTSILNDSEFAPVGDLFIIYTGVPDGSEDHAGWLYETSFTSDLHGATITPMSRSNIYGGDELWLLVKDGKEGDYLFDLFNLFINGNYYRWDGTDTLELRNFYPGNGTISHISLFSEIPRSQVPEPSTMILLGFGLVGLALFGRETLKK